MIVAGVLVKTVPGAAPRVAAALATRPELDLQGGDGDRRLALVWTGPSGAALLHAARALLAEHPAILGLYPTLVGDDGGP